MIPRRRVVTIAACVLLTACDVTPGHESSTTIRTTKISTQDSATSVMRATCDDADGKACVIQIDQGAKRRMVTLPEGRTIQIANADGDTQVCVATEATKAAGCPMPPPPPAPPPPPKQS
jgi:outer membrane biogenesis lipoprotein LolB